MSSERSLELRFMSLFISPCDMVLVSSTWTLWLFRTSRTSERVIFLPLSLYAVLPSERTPLEMEMSASPPNSRRTYAFAERAVLLARGARVDQVLEAVDPQPAQRPLAEAEEHGVADVALAGAVGPDDAVEAAVEEEVDVLE